MQTLHTLVPGRRPTTTVRRLSAITMTNLLKEPDKHAGILPALAVFMRCCVAVHTVPCPTYRRMGEIKLNDVRSAMVFYRMYLLVVLVPGTN